MTASEHGEATRSPPAALEHLDAGTAALLAESLLQEAGYAKGADGFYTKDGQKLGPWKLITPQGWTDWNAALEVVDVAAQLRELRLEPLWCFACAALSASHRCRFSDMSAAVQWPSSACSSPSADTFSSTCASMGLFASAADERSSSRNSKRAIGGPTAGPSHTTVTLAVVLKK